MKRLALLALVLLPLGLSLVGSIPPHGYGFIVLGVVLFPWFQRKAERPRLLLYGLGVLLQALAFPEPDQGYLGLVLLVPYLIARERPDGASWWRSATLYGFLRAFAGLYWLGGIHYSAWFGTALGSGLLFAFVFELFVRRCRFLSYGVRVATGWVLYEWVHSWCMGGVPWLYVAHTQHAYSWMIQSADLFGAFGLSFLLVFFQAAGLRMVLQRSSREFSVAVSLLVANLIYGIARPPPREVASDGPEILLIQTAIPQNLKWDRGRNPDEYQRRLEGLTKEALAAHPKARLVVWGETMHTYPYFESWKEEFPRADRREAYMLRAFPAQARKTAASAKRQVGHPVRFAYGVNGYRSLAQRRAHRGYNSVVMVDEAGAVEGIYHKQYLVPMGEKFLPRSVLPDAWTSAIMGWLVQNLGYPHTADLEAGEGYAVLEALDGLRCAPLICFEGLYPHMTREATNQEGVDFILHLANYGWFGRSWQQRQAQAICVFRAIETRTAIVTCANGGVSCAVDPWGEFLGEPLGVMEKGFLAVQVPARWHKTLYSRGGWLLPPVSIALWCLFAAWRFRRRKRPAEGAREPV